MLQKSLVNRCKKHQPELLQKKGKHRGPLQKTLENCCKKHHRRKKHRCKLEKHHCLKIHHLLLEKHQFPTQFTQGSPKAKFCNFCIPFQPIVKPILQYKSFCPWKQHHSWLWILKKHGKIPWGMSMACFHIYCWHFYIRTPRKIPMALQRRAAHLDISADRLHVSFGFDGFVEHLMNNAQFGLQLRKKWRSLDHWNTLLESGRIMYDNVDDDDDDDDDGGDDDDDGNIWKSATFWGFNGSNML